MKFTKGSAVERPLEVANVYEVVIETMHGDADGYDDVLVTGIKLGDEDLLEDLIETLERMKNEYPNGRGGGDDYYHVKGFNKWFNSESMDEDEYEALSDREQYVLSEWAYSNCGMGYQASIQSFEVFLYDENGVKFNVDVIK